MSRQAWFGAAVLLVATAFAAVGAAWPPAVGGVDNVVALVRVEGAITGGGESSLLAQGGARADRLMKILEAVREDPAVRAVVVRVNSPGGTAAASYEIGRALDRVRETGRPVVASMGDMAASGGYWVSAHADHIVASPGTITGSIGVIMQFANLQELYDKLGIVPITIKSGPHKDIGAMDRPMTAEEQALLQDMIDDLHSQFVAVVARGRKLPEDEVRRLADGRIYSGSQARQVGLVDDLGNLDDAVRKAAAMAGLAEGEYSVREAGRRTRLEELLDLPQVLTRLAVLPGLVERWLGDAFGVGGAGPLQAR